MKTEEPTQMFQIQCSDNPAGPYSNNWLAYDGAEFTEEKADFEVAQCQKFWPRHSYKKILSGSMGGSRAQIAFATQNHNRPMEAVLKDGDEAEIQARFDQNNRNADTGKLYQPSQKWTCTLLHRNGSVCSVGGPFNNTRSSIEGAAKQEALQHMATCFVFSRNQTGCKLVSVHYWDDKNQFVISRKVRI